MKTLEEKYGVRISLGTIRFTETEINTKLSAVSTSTLVAKALTTSGLPLEAKIGARFKLPGKRSIYTIVGFNPRAPKFNLEVRTDTGTSYRMPSGTLSRAILIS